MRVWLKRIGIICLIPIALLLLVSILLYVPPIQRFLVEKAMGYATESMGVNVHFERIRLTFPLNLSVRNALITDARQDTMMRLDKLTVEVGLMPLFKGNVSVKGVLLESLELNTDDLLDGMIIRGHVGKAHLRADSVSLVTERALLNEVTLSQAEIDFFMCDTMAIDTTSAGINWCVELQKIKLEKVAFACRMPCDSLFLHVRVEDALLTDGVADLGTGRYGASTFQAHINELFYGTDLTEPAPGLDFSHLLLTSISLSLDSMLYGGGTDMSAVIKECTAQERSGFAIKTLTGRVVSDRENIRIPDFLLETAASTIEMQADVPWASIDEQNPEGRLSLDAKARIGKHDALLMLGSQAQVFQQYYPDTVFVIEMRAEGHVADLTLRKFYAELPGAFQADLTCSVRDLLDEHLRMGRVDCSVETQDLDFAAGLLSSALQKRVQIPDSMLLSGVLTMNKGLYDADILLQEEAGTIHLTGNYNEFRKSYAAILQVDSLAPVHFMPDDSLMCLDAYLHVKGQGTDLFHSSTEVELEGKISNICYGLTSVSDVTLSGGLEKNQVQAELVSAYPLLKGKISVNGELRKDKISGMLIVDVDSLDFYGLRMTEDPLSTSFQIFSEIETDLKNTHALDITLGNWELMFEKQRVQPKMLTIGLRSDADTTRASFYAGDLTLMLTGNAGLEALANDLIRLSGEAQKQIHRDSIFDIQALRPNFPDMTLRVTADRDNPLYNFMQEYNYFFETFRLDATISPEEGLHVKGALYAFVKDTLKIDTIRLSVWQDTLGLLYEAGVVKNRFRNQEPFHAGVNGFLRKNEANLLASYINGKGETGLMIGLEVKKIAEGFDFHITSEKPILAFIPFTVNKDNYFRFKSLQEMEANVRLEGSTDASLWIHSENNDDTMNEVMIELNQFDLHKISTGFSGLPNLGGLLTATMRYIPEENSFMLIADGNIDDFYYENGRIGELLLNATYMPMDKGTHQIDLHAFHEMSEIAALSVLYKSGRYENKIDGVISINQLPLHIFDAMVPEQMARMEGMLVGNFSITGTDIKPEVTGTLQLEKASAFIVPSSTTLRFDEKPINMEKNNIRIDQYKIYTQADHPFVIDGSIDARNINRPVADLRLTANNLRLIDSKRSPESIAFGRLFVNVNSTVTGPLQSLRMRGNLRVLGNTNLTYVMLDSPLEVQDGFNDLVTFTYFADTLPRRTRRPFNFVGRTGQAAMATGMDMLMTISIDPVVRIRVELDDEQENFVELRGGGDLSLQYTAQGDMSLNGRYTLSDGTIRYSIPVIPLTDFSVKNGSYVDWSGDLLNPYLNIAAYTRVRSAVNLDGQSRMVDFNTGIQLRDNFEDVSVDFLLEAPTDAVIQNQLISMGEEERGKQAVSLLVTGVYLASTGTGKESMDVGLALNTLLQREIKNMLGSLMGDVPFSFDVNTYDGTQGMGRRIDYIGRFYKDFFNDRLNTALGLRYSTKDPVYGNKFFLDDISAEYRLDTDGARAVKVFRSKEYENLFENEITKIGVGFSLHRKAKRFRDLFIFRKKDTAIIKEEEVSDEMTEEQDSDVGKEVDDTSK